MTDTIDASDTAFRLTFNLPAQKFLFDDESVIGVRIRMDGGRVSFKATNSTRGTDCIGFTKRRRGGYQVRIEGDMADDLLNLLTQEATLAQPFFLLKRTAKGWFDIEHFKSNAAPPKFTPHMRVWMPRDKKHEPDISINDEITTMLGDFTAIVRVAKQLVGDYDKNRRIGRPPKDIVEAREVLLAFESLAREIIPTGFNTSVDIEPIRQVAEIINGYVRDHDMAVATEIKIDIEAAVEKSTAASSSTKQRVPTNNNHVPNFILVDGPPLKRRGRPIGSKNRSKVIITRDVPATDMVAVA